MEDHNNNQSSSNHGSSSTSTEPVRSRWTPKPEQILILESIFNSGMVNPPKDETVRIRKMLEKFGAVGDANVFYWFQNRRSRSRRRQRQLQAAGLAAAAATAGDQPMSMNSLQHQQLTASPHGGAVQYSSSTGSLGFGSCNNSSLSYFLGPSSISSFFLGPSCSSSSSSSSSASSSSSSSCSSSSGGGGCDNNNGMENFFTMSGQMGYQEIEHHHHQYSSNVTSILSPTDQNSNFHYQQGIITVFINGIPTEVPRGPIDMKAMFGEDLVLVHSSGVPLPINEYGFLMQSLQHGEAYFLFMSIGCTAKNTRTDPDIDKLQELFLLSKKLICQNTLFY